MVLRGALNWADLSFVLLLLLCGMLAPACAAGDGATGWGLVLFVLGGLAAGFGLGVCSLMAAYWALRKAVGTTGSTAFWGVVYLSIPAFALTGGPLLVGWLAARLARAIW